MSIFKRFLNRKCYSFYCLLALLAVIATGCGTPTSEKVGSTHVAVVSVTDWHEYKKELSPKFNIDGSSALSQSIPSTLSVEDKIVNAITARLGIQASGSDIPLPSNSDNTSSQKTPVTDAPSRINPNNLDVNPSLQYLAATALYQEVKLLNRYVLDAPTREGYQPYIIRVQVTNLPYSRKSSHDTFVNMAFYTNKVNVGSSIKSKLQQINCKIESLKKLNKDEAKKMIDNLRAPLRDALQSLNDVSKKEEDFLAKIDDISDKLCCPTLQVKATQREWDKVINSVKNEISEIQNLINSKQKIEKQSPIVIPMLVTDHIEAALLSRTRENTLEFALALSAAFSGIGGNVNLESIDQRIRSLAGREFNSLFTIGRLADNAVRIRIGAHQKPGHDLPKAGKAETNAGYQTIPQTHYVTLLVLVPGNKGPKEEEKTVYFGSKFEYRDSETGKDISPKISKYLPRNIDHQVVKEILLAKGYTNEFIEYLADHDDKQIYYKLSYYALNSDYQKYISLIKNDEKTLAEANRLWLEFTSNLSGLGYDSGSFKVKVKKKQEPSVFSEYALLLDDGKSTRVSAFQTKGIQPAKVNAILKWHSDTKSLASTSVSLKENGELVMLFPSLFKLKEISNRQDLSDAKIEIWHDGKKLKQGPIDISNPIASATKTNFELILNISKLQLIPDQNNNATFEISWNINEKSKDKDGKPLTYAVATQTDKKVKFQIIFEDAAVSLADPTKAKGISKVNDYTFNAFSIDTKTGKSIKMLASNIKDGNKIVIKIINGKDGMHKAPNKIQIVSPSNQK